MSAGSGLKSDGLIEVLLEEDVLHHKNVAVVRAASLILAQLVKGYAAQIVKGDTSETLGGVVKAAHSLSRKYVMGLLSAMAQVEGAWKVAEQHKAALVTAVEAVQAEREQEKGVEFKRHEFHQCAHRAPDGQSDHVGTGSFSDGFPNTLQPTPRPTSFPS